MRDVLGAAAYDAVRPHLEEALQGKPKTYDALVPYLTGGTRWIEATYIPKTNQAGAVEGVVALVHDVTDRKRNEEALERAVRARDVFLSIASHELKTPLTPLMLQLQGIERMIEKLNGAVPPERILEKVGKAGKQVVHLDRLVNDLLDVSRLTENRLELELETVDLAKLVAEVVERVCPDLETARCDVSTKVDGDVIGTWDRRRLDQVVSNLLSNAIKYGEGKPIHVAVRSDGDTAVLVVRDEGIGISPDDRERIFGRFERAVSDRSYGGFGLGLWIVREVIEAMGGRIRLDSQMGAGSTFTVELPKERSVAHET
jgi:signal transduction histidine kinase